MSFVFGGLERFLPLLRLRLMPSESAIILSYTAAGEDGESMGELEREKKWKERREDGGNARWKDACCVREEGRGDNSVRVRQWR